MTLRVEQGFVGETREAIVDVKDGKLYMCYNLDRKGRPKSFTTSKDGNNDRLMIFVPDEDPREVIKTIAARSEKKWLAFRDEDANFFNGTGPAKGETIISPRFTLVGRDGVNLDRNKIVLDMLYENGREDPGSKEQFFKPRKKDPSTKLDNVKITEQIFRRFGETIIETGRAVASKKNQKGSVWDVRYTSVWVREQNQWQLVSEQQTPVK
jgi:hypothetical protein